MPLTRAATSSNDNYASYELMPPTASYCCDVGSIDDVAVVRARRGRPARTVMSCCSNNVRFCGELPRCSQRSSTFS